MAWSETHTLPSLESSSLRSTVASSLSLSFSVVGYNDWCGFGGDLRDGTIHLEGPWPDTCEPSQRSACNCRLSEANRSTAKTAQEQAVIAFQSASEFPCALPCLLVFPWP